VFAEHRVAGDVGQRHHRTQADGVTGSAVHATQCRHTLQADNLLGRLMPTLHVRPQVGAACDDAHLLGIAGQVLDHFTGRLRRHIPKIR